MKRIRILAAAGVPVAVAAVLTPRFRALAGLSNLGVMFSELGRPADALPATQEAITIRRELAAAPRPSAPLDLSPDPSAAAGTNPALASKSP